MFKLCWIKKDSWGETGGYGCCTKHDTIEDIIKIMSKCIYNGEWIEDKNGNKLDIDLSKVAVTR